MIYEELHAIQRQFGYLPAAELASLSSRSSVPLYRLHGVASFYPHFRLAPPPKADVRICCDMSCHLNGADDLRAALERRYQGAAPGDFALREVSCLGQCDGAPAMSVNDQIFTCANSAMADRLVRDALAGQPMPEQEHNGTPQRLASDPYEPTQRYGALRKYAASRDGSGLIVELKASGLRGLGGAGFPTGTKWEIVKSAPGDEKFIVCNADESEPGTFKDRFILQNIPHLVVEGMILAGFFTGARKGIFYIRHEYESFKKVFADEVRACYREGLLGKNILGSSLNFDLEVFTSPGGYICGEETALLEAIEEKRAEPRNKPPFPGINGLWQKPTVINNVETFSNVPLILVRGADWFKSQGDGGAPGLKFIGVSGCVKRPGVYEVPMGAPASDVIFNRAGGPPDGRQLKAFAPSGPSSGYLPASMTDVHMDFKSLADAGSMLGSGALVVCDDSACMLDMALNSTKFFRNESCGKCVPCRVGSQKFVDILTAWSRGQGSASDLALVEELSQALTLTSICGLGQVVPAPIASVLRHFPDEVTTHYKELRCPAGVCPVSRARPS
ncbi:MAG TPA: NAD(P)H-dependent oxidoreductase subunit E [Candidatus Acidoferrales bacterium]|nr:NAD(P)H-dependent oxidoreductase subunit E [Candidatus Acidoferrales bacterium]